MSDQKHVLVTGATGYVGGRLVPLLLEKGCKVRCLVRQPERLSGKEWVDKVELVQGDVLDSASLKGVFEGIHTAYYLIHSLRSSDFAQKDKEAAKNFAVAAREQALENIVYLGGLCQEDDNLSEHLKSRNETGKALRENFDCVTEFRSAVIVGSGSISFELIRYLTERVPIMVCPKWVYNRTQPVSIRTVLEYLTAILDKPEAAGEIFEIGSSEKLTYGQMMLKYAEIRGLKRILLPVPVLTPRLSSMWVNLVTPVPGSVAKPLILGLKNENLIKSDNAEKFFPEIIPDSYETALTRALERMKFNKIETTWSDALSSSLKDNAPLVLKSQEGLIMEHRQLKVNAKKSEVYKIFSGIGGRRGWYFWGWSWKIRGFMDKMIGGVGLRRGRRHPNKLSIGDALDFWRVEHVLKDEEIRLRAEMKVPGKAWLQFKVEEESDGSCMLYQTAFFEPKGIIGLIYWYSLYPAHKIIFSGLIRKIAKYAEGRKEWPQL